MVLANTAFKFRYNSLVKVFSYASIVLVSASTTIEILNDFQFLSLIIHLLILLTSVYILYLSIFMEYTSKRRGRHIIKFVFYNTIFYLLSVLVIILKL